MELLIDFVMIAISLLFLSLWWKHLLPASSSSTKPTKPKNRLPPGPPGWPLVGNLFQVILERRHFVFVVGELRKKYGPIFTMQMGQRTLVIITSPELIHEALVQRGTTFANRPPDSPIRLIFSVGKCAVNSAEYGPFWRTLRRNFVTELISPVRIRQCSWIREWALGHHMKTLEEAYSSKRHVDVALTCRQAVGKILVCICFGAKISDEWISDIDDVIKEVMLITTPQFPDFLPVLTPLFRSQVRKAKQLRKRQMECLLPLIRGRRAFVQKATSNKMEEDKVSISPNNNQPPNQNGSDDWSSSVLEMVSPVGAAYVDSLFNLDTPGRGRLGEEELLTVCTELFVAGIDTTTTVLQWVFYELVVNQDIQEKLHEEIVSHVGKTGLINEEHVEKMEYLNAVVKESLRLHSPAHMVLSHAATEDTEIGGYKVPANAYVEFYIEWMTEDPGLWVEPDRFKPERFLEGGDGFGVDLTGTKGSVKMLPFGAGRRTCPGLSLGLLHVNLMLARMVQRFKWVPVPGSRPDPTECFAFTVVMKDPLKAVLLSK